MDNIIIFPLHRVANAKERPPQNVNELLEVIEEERMIMIDEIVDEIVPDILTATHQFGFPIDNDYDIGFLIEALRSAMMRSRGLENPMQEVADKMVVVRNEKGQHVYANGEILTP